MSLARVLLSSAVTLTHQFAVDEALTDAAGNVTVAVKRLDGTDAAGTFAGNATHTTQGTYTWALSPSAVLDTWSVDWTGTFGGVPVTARDYVEIVGGFYFGIGEARTELQLAASITAATIAGKRIAVEQECEDMTQRVFVPRFRRVRLSGNGTPSLGTPDRYLRSVRAASVAGVALAGTDLTALSVTNDGRIVRPGAVFWPAGAGNVIVEYEVGHDYPPDNIRTAAMTRLRSLIQRPKSGVPDRAISYTMPDGGSYRVSTPARQRTGIPDVDGVYDLYYRPKRAVIA